MGLRTQKTCRDYPKTQRINKTGTARNSQKRTVQQQLPSKPAKEIVSSEEEQILKQVNKYELTTKFTGGNTKLFAKN